MHPASARVRELSCERPPAASKFPGGSGIFPARLRAGEIKISERTIWKWLSRFRAGGVDALRDHVRKDKGCVRALPAAVLDRAEVRRRELPTRWTSTVLDILAREGTLASTDLPHPATVDRHLRSRGASRRQLVVLGEKVTIKMRFDGSSRMGVRCTSVCAAVDAFCEARYGDRGVRVLLVLRELGFDSVAAVLLFLVVDAFARSPVVTVSRSER